MVVTPRSTYGTLKRAPGKRWIMSGVPPHVAIRLKSTFEDIPKEATGTFMFEDTDEVCTDLDWFLNRYPMQLSLEDRLHLSGQRKAFEVQRDEIERILMPDWMAPERSGFRPPYALRHRQAQAVEILLRKKRLLVMDDVGEGKTLVALGALAGSQYLPAAVVADAHMPSQWAEFIAKFTYMTSHIIRGTKPYSLPPANIYLFRYTNIGGWVDVADTGFFKAVIFDEVQSLRRGDSTSKGRAAKVFTSRAKLKAGLSATPVFNYGDEIFHIVEVLDPGALGGWFDFLREWCKSDGNHWLVKDPDALGSYLRERQLVVRRLRDGRPINKHVVEVETDEEAVADQEALARKLAVKVVSGSFTERGQAARELDALTRHMTGVAKARGVSGYVRMLLKAGTPVLLTGWHRDVYDTWLKDLADFNPVMFTGSESPKQKDHAKRAFIKGDTDLCIMSLRSGVGLDGLQARCRTVVFGELDWTPQIHEQIVGRLDREGQPADSIDAIYAWANFGSDPIVMSVHGVKGHQARGIVDPQREVEFVQADPTRLKRLAESFLERAGQ